MANVRLSTIHTAIRGTGVAASCCTHLLEAAGLVVSHDEGQRPRIPKIPAILLSTAAQALLRDVYGQPGLLDSLFRIDRRIVAWEPGSPPVTLPHQAAVISEEALLERLHRAPSERTPANEADWTVYASRPLPVSVEQHRFGSRTASVVPVNLKSAGQSACWIEALECGWLFLVPDSVATGWLISVGGEPENLLAESRLIAVQVEVSGVARAAFPAYPGMADGVCAPGWLACGTAALSFDPLCGDGTGNAVREAILAAAVIRAAGAGGNVDRLLAHYRARLLAGFARHLEMCRDFYTSGNRGHWWEREFEALEAGIAWCRGAVGEGNGFHYRLSGFELQAIK
jgi:hypothetical protein